VHLSYLDAKCRIQAHPSQFPPPGTYNITSDVSQTNARISEQAKRRSRSQCFEDYIVRWIAVKIASSQARSF